MEARVADGQAGGLDPFRRELLRQPGRHHDGQEARREGEGRRLRAGASVAKQITVEARDRQRPARVPGVRGDLRRHPFRGLWRQGREAAEAPLGLDLDQGPVAARSLLRRGAGRPRHRRHHAAGDAGGVSRPRRPEDPHRGRPDGRPGARSAVSRSSGSTRPESSATSRRRGSASSPTPTIP